MFTHVMLGSNDLDRARSFYDALLAVVGAPGGENHVDESGKRRLFYRHDGGLFSITEPINGEPATVANGCTIGFKCSSAEQVLRFHDAAVAAGGSSVEDPPGVRETPFGPVHLAYVRDLDGHKLCAMYMAGA